MARHGSENIYGHITNSAAESIASAALDNVSISTNDDLFKTPETAKGFEGEIIHLNTGITGSAKGGHTHKGDVTGGSDEVMNDRAAHERHSLRDESPTHAGESVSGHK
jgi:hypothetical protein